MSKELARSSSPRSFRRTAGRGFALLLALCLVVYIGLGAVVALLMTRPERNFAPERSPATQQLAYQDVRLPARGGDVELAAWYIPHAGSRQALVVVHGKDASRTHQYGGRMAEVLAGLYRRGFTLLAIDLRGHGQSGDAHLSFGIKEHRDVLGAVDWLRAQGYAPGSIGVLGVSLGGASVLMAAAREPAIGATVADCSYAAVEPIVRAKFREATHLPTLFLLPTRLVGRVLYGYDAISARPVDDVAGMAPRPLLIIHGDADDFTPVAHAYELHAAYPRSELWVLPGVKHARAFAHDPAAYIDRVATFFAAGLGR